MPQIIGNMQRVKGGFEASFVAFRIDDSNQVDIICSVIVCKTSCTEYYVFNLSNFFKQIYYLNF